MLGMNYDKNKQEVLKSPIVAKAVIKRNNSYEVIVVFQKSTRHEFYWIFRAKSQRSPRRSWKFTGQYFGRDFNTVGPYKDFGSFVEYYARTHSWTVLNVRMPQARRLAALLVRTEQETIHSDWTPAQELSTTMRIRTEEMNHRKLIYIMR